MGQCVGIGLVDEVVGIDFIFVQVFFYVVVGSGVVQKFGLVIYWFWCVVEVVYQFGGMGVVVFDLDYQYVVFQCVQYWIGWCEWVYYFVD